MDKKTRNIIIIAGIALLVILGAVAAWHCYQESQKSELEKAAEKTADWGSDALDKTNDAAKKLFGN